LCKVGIVDWSAGGEFEGGELSGDRLGENERRRYGQGERVDEKGKKE
jgi:hypothetical protein